MGDPKILWIDMRQDKASPSAGAGQVPANTIRALSDPGNIDFEIEGLKPRLLCFDFDLPDQVGLNLLQSTKARFPSLPLVMLTGDHSVDLAIWALRLRVWDYFIKPVALQEILKSVRDLLHSPPDSATPPRRNLKTPPQFQHDALPYRIPVIGNATQPAVAYLRRHYHGTVTLGDVASLCDMSKSHFSRTFKAENGMTFQEFLTCERIERAKTLLLQSDLPITEIALRVGFREPGNFSRAFQRCIGIQPSRYRQTRPAPGSE